MRIIRNLLWAAFLASLSTLSPAATPATPATANASAPAAAPAPNAATPATPAAAAEKSLDINTASADQFAEVMVGVGKAKAEAIVKDRETNGKFNSVDDLDRVKGIGKATIEKNRPKLTAN